MSHGIISYRIITKHCSTGAQYSIKMK